MPTVDNEKMSRLFAQARRIAEHREAGAEKELRKLYKSMYKDLQTFVSETYVQYAEDDKLTFAMLQKAGYDARFLEEIEQHINVTTPKTAQELRALVEETYRIAYEGMVNGVARAGVDGLDAAFAEHMAITPEQIKRAVENPVSGLTLKDTLEKNRKEIIYSIKQTVGVGLMNGDRYSTMARRIAEVVDGDYKKAVRIARTEAHRTREAGNYDAATGVDQALQNSGLDMRMVKTWRSMQDERVRPQRRRKGRKGWSTKMGKGPNHMILDGQTVLADENFDLMDGRTSPAPGLCRVAGHDINCRCYASYEMLEDAEYFEKTGKHFPGWKGEATGSGLAQKIADIKQKIANGGGSITEDHLHEAGKAVQAEIKQNPAYASRMQDIRVLDAENRSCAAEYNAIAKQRDENQKQFQKKLAQYRKAGKDEAELFDEVNRIEQELFKKQLEAHKKWVEVNNRLQQAQNGAFFKNADDVKATLAKIREMGYNGIDINGHLNRSRSEMKTPVMQAYGYYPKAWVEKSVQHSRLTPKKVDRGYYDEYNKVIAISGGSDASRFSTAVHELGHRMEVVIPGIREAEKAFYDRRTQGESLVWMGAGYRKDEVTRFDQFINKYMGKDYGGTFYELVSMGFEYAYTDPERLMTDPDMSEWIYGLLALM